MNVQDWSKIGMFFRKNNTIVQKDNMVDHFLLLLSQFKEFISYRKPHYTCALCKINKIGRNREGMNPRIPGIDGFQA